MEGRKDLKPFSQLPEIFRNNSRTKVAYSKHNAIWRFIREYPGGVDKCIADYRGNPYQLYEQKIKRVHTSETVGNA